MSKHLFVVTILLASTAAYAGSHGPCKIKSLSESDSYPGYMLVKMECAGTDLPASCTNLLTDTLAYETTSETGKVRTSILLAAHLAGRDVQISSWGMCPASINNVPLLYGITL